MASFPVMPSTANLNFRNDLLLMNGGAAGGGGGGSGGGAGNLRFSGMFGGGVLETNLDANGAKPRLPIWLDQHVNESHHENPCNSSFLGSSSSNNNSGGMLPPEMVQWLNGSQEAVATYTGMQLKEEEENKGEMQFNSLYNYTTSTTPPPPPPPPPAHMSATALLQKAAQMGSTRSTNPGVTSGFGLMTTSLSNFNSSSPENSDGLMMMMSTMGSKKSMGNGVNKSHDGDLTRDFLGVRGNERRSFSLQQELIKYSSPMDDPSI